MEIKQRIQQYLDYKGIRTATFEKSVGLSNGYWRKTMSISANCVASIIRTYSDLSVVWVILGEGQMLNTDSPNASKRLYLDIIAKRDETIRNLESEIVELKSQLLAV